MEIDKSGPITVLIQVYLISHYIGGVAGADMWKEKGDARTRKMIANL